MFPIRPMPSGPSYSGMGPIMAGTGGAGTVRLLRPGRPEGPVPAALGLTLVPVLILAAPALSQEALVPDLAADSWNSAAPAAPTDPAAALAAMPGEGDFPAAPLASAVHGPAGEVPDPGAPVAVDLAAPEAVVSGAAELATGSIRNKTLSSFSGGRAFFLRRAPAGRAW